MWVCLHRARRPPPTPPLPLVRSLPATPPLTPPSARASSYSSSLPPPLTQGSRARAESKPARHLQAAMASPPRRSFARVSACRRGATRPPFALALARYACVGVLRICCRVPHVDQGDGWRPAARDQPARAAAFEGPPPARPMEVRRLSPQAPSRKTPAGRRRDPMQRSHAAAIPRRDPTRRSHAAILRDDRTHQRSHAARHGSPRCAALPLDSRNPTTLASRHAALTCTRPMRTGGSSCCCARRPAGSPWRALPSEHALPSLDATPS